MKVRILLVALFSIIFIHEESHAQKGSSDAESNSAFVENAFRGISAMLESAESSSNERRSAVVTTPAPIDKTKHEHFSIEKGSKCVVVGSNTISATVNGEEIELTCSDLGLTDNVSGPFKFGPLCSCIVKSPEELCAAQNQGFWNRWAELSLKKKIRYTHEGQEYLIEVDLKGCYSCDPPNGPYCNIKDRTTQPGGCDTTSGSGGTSGGSQQVRKY